MKNIFNLNKSTLKSKLVGASISAFALSDSKTLLRTLLKEAWRIAVLSMGSVKSLTSRVKIFNNFMQQVDRVYRHHGASFTIKWLKGNSVALQRYLAKTPYHSLREIEPSLPLPRLCGGLPSVITVGDRHLIRKGHTGVIRFWLSLFNVYRVLDAPLNPKLNTITDPCKAQEDIQLGFKKFVDQNLWGIIPGIKPSDIRTSASYIHKTQSAGPNVHNALYGYFTDLTWWAQSETDYLLFKEYCKVSKSSVLFNKFDSGITLLFNLLEAGARIPIKGSFAYDSSVDGEAAINSLPLQPGQLKAGKVGYINPSSLLTHLRGGQLALKVEAAGKVRVFAIADIWTQSVLAPLHDSIFKLLKRLPNDGTFDQDKSFIRCQEKATTFSSAFSIDLSAATDRLPITIQSYVLDALTKVPGFGEAWRRLLVEREYVLPTTYQKSEQFKNLKLPWGEGLQYATGQPMGALSSWGMLALTHHLIVQFAAHRVGARGLSPWYEFYEVLGDDIVIFDDRVADEYKKIMSLLDVGTNPSKSIPSPNAPTCEFAKRTSVGMTDVSGLSWKEFLQGNNLPGKINLALRLGSKLLFSEECLKAILVRTGSDLGSPLKNGIAHGLIGILGSLLTKVEGKSLIPALSLLASPALINGEEDYFPKKVSIPMRQAIQLILHLFKNQTSIPLSTLLSHYKDRVSFVRSEIAPFASQTAYLLGLVNYRNVVNNYDTHVTYLANMLLDVSRVESKILKAQVRSVAEDILLQDTDPQDRLDAYLAVISKFREEPPLDKALELLSGSEAYMNSFELQTARPKGIIPTENALALMASRAGEAVPKYWTELPEFRGFPELGLHAKDWLRSAIKDQPLIRPQ
jgi:hypothetical protein